MKSRGLLMAHIWHALSPVTRPCGRLARRPPSASVLKDKEKEHYMSQPAKTVTACIVVIGNEILSGRTRDANIQYLATELAVLGVQVREGPIIPAAEATAVPPITTGARPSDYA